MAIINASLRIATFNIRYGTARDGIHSWPLRKYATQRALTKLHADIFGLQESMLFQTEYLQQRLLGYEHHGSGRDHDGTGEACPLFFRSGSFSVHDSWTRWIGPTPERVTKLKGATSPRIITFVRLSNSEGQLLDVFNTHLDQRDNERRRMGMNQLLSCVDPAIPTIVLGDFNAHHDNDIFSDITDAGLRLADTATLGPTSFYNWNLPGDPHALDHIMVSRHFQVKNVCVVRKRRWMMLPSDHWPVCADVAITH